MVDTGCNCLALQYANRSLPMALMVEQHYTEARSTHNSSRERRLEFQYWVFVLLQRCKAVRSHLWREERWGQVVAETNGGKDDTRRERVHEPICEVGSCNEFQDLLMNYYHTPGPATCTYDANRCGGLEKAKKQSMFRPRSV